MKPELQAQVLSKRVIPVSAELPGQSGESGAPGERSVMEQPSDKGRSGWGPLSAYRQIAVQFVSAEERNRALDYFFDQEEELFGVPFVPLIGRDLMLLPEDALPLLDKKKLKFSKSRAPRQGGGFYWFNRDDLHQH